MRGYDTHSESNWTRIVRCALFLLAVCLVAVVWLAFEKDDETGTFASDLSERCVASGGILVEGIAALEDDVISFSLCMPSQILSASDGNLHSSSTNVCELDSE